MLLIVVSCYRAQTLELSWVAQSCPAVCDPMDCSMPGLPVHFLELAQTHGHQVGDAIQLSHPLLSPSPPAFSLYQHRGLFQWVSSYGTWVLVSPWHVESSWTRDWTTSRQILNHWITREIYQCGVVKVFLYLPDRWKMTFQCSFDLTFLQSWVRLRICSYILRELSGFLWICFISFVIS